MAASAQKDGIINDKEFITFLGPSGCGKTTMLRMIAGFEKPTSGEILIGDTVVSSGKKFVPPEHRGIGMVFQSYAVWPHMTVFDNVAYPLKIAKMGKAEIKANGKIELTGLGQSIPYQGTHTGKVVVAIRPENITLSPQTPSPAGTLEGILLSMFYLGDTNDCRIEINGEILRVIAESGSFDTLKEGQKITAGIKEFLVYTDE